MDDVTQLDDGSDVGDVPEDSATWDAEGSADVEQADVRDEVAETNRPEGSDAGRLEGRDVPEAVPTWDFESLATREAEAKAQADATQPAPPDNSTTPTDTATDAPNPIVPSSQPARGPVEGPQPKETEPTPEKPTARYEPLGEKGKTKKPAEPIEPQEPTEPTEPTEPIDPSKEKGFNPNPENRG